MADVKCARCRFRARYDANPRSFLGRLWKWHTRWCPGWKHYLQTLSAQERMELIGRYDLPESTFRK